MAYLSFIIDKKTKNTLESLVEQRFHNIVCNHVTVALDWLPYSVYAQCAIDMNRRMKMDQVIIFASPSDAKFDHLCQIVPVTILYAPPDDIMADSNAPLWYQRQTSPERVYHITHSLSLGTPPKAGKHLAALWPSLMTMPGSSRKSIDTIREYAKERGWIELSGQFASAK